MRRQLAICIILGLSLFATAIRPLSAEDGDRGASESEVQMSFDLTEIPFDKACASLSELQHIGHRVYLGLEKTEYTEDSTKPEKEVKKYPSLKSDKPLYGTVRFGTDPLHPKEGTDYHFVLDASEPGKYDCLYFDADHDLDLTNDPSIKVSTDKWPEGLWARQDDKEDRFHFEELSVPMDFGSDLGIRPVKMLPLLFVQQEKTATLMFVSMAFRGGQIKIDDKQFDVILAQPNFISGRFDCPWTATYLTPPGKTNAREYWWGADRLGAYRRVNGKFYTLAASPMGDKLIVKLYDGDLGTFKVGPGPRDLKDLKMSGSLISEQLAVAIGTFKEKEEGGYLDFESVEEFQIPTGDYTIDYLSVHYGPLRISLSVNYHSDGIPRDPKRENKFAIAIRKDQPFTLDFSNAPDVMFASPAKDQTFAPGDDISVKAVLIDPKLGVMIRNLDDTREKVKKETDLGDGKKESYERQKSLDPVVTIVDSAGKTVSEGPMPFG